MSYTLIITPEAFCILKQMSFFVCSLYAKINQMLPLQGWGNSLLWKHKAHSGPFETARTNIRVQPHQKPSTVTIDWAVSGKQNRSNGNLEINSYLIDVAHVGFYLLSLADLCVLVWECMRCKAVWVCTCMRAHGWGLGNDFLNAVRRKQRNYIKMTGNFLGDN